MIYLASPYSHPDQRVREQRFDWACRVASDLMKEGWKIFSPIAHSHPIARYGLPTDYDYWKDWNHRLIRCMQELWVLKLPGYEDSKGLTGEIKFAIDEGKALKYLEFSTYICFYCSEGKVWRLPSRCPKCAFPLVKALDHLTADELRQATAKKLMNVPELPTPQYFLAT